VTLTLHDHPFAAYCWKALIALYERGVPFEAHQVDGLEGRVRLAELWPLASIPVLVDDEADVVLPESTTVVEYVDGFGDAPPLIPAGRDAALQARLWDRIVDGHVMTPMQKVVLNALRGEGRGDPVGVAEAVDELARVYEVLERQLAGHAWLAGDRFTLADCAAAPALHYARLVHRWDEPRLQALTAYFTRLVRRPSVARVIEEARPYRPNFPLPWPDWADSLS
jgi:glutathione S-transferase